MPEGKFFELVSKHSGCALGPLQLHDTPPAGTPLATVGRNDGDDRLYFYTDAITGTIRHKTSGLCIHVNPDGNVVLQQFQQGNPAQLWALETDTVKNRKDGRVLDIVASNTGVNAAICAWKLHGGNNQKWDPVFQKPRYFSLKSELNGKMLDIEGANRAAGANVDMWDANKGDNQMWFEDRNGLLRSKLNEFVFDSSTPVLTMQPWDPLNPKRQWVYTNYGIAQLSDPNTVLDISGENKANGAKLCAYKNRGAANQKWTLVYA